MMSKILRYIEKVDIFFDDTIRYIDIENDISIYRVITNCDESEESTRRNVASTIWQLGHNAAVLVQYTHILLQRIQTVNILSLIKKIFEKRNPSGVRSKNISHILNNN